MPEPTFTETAMELDAHIARRLRSTAQALADDGIPPTIVAHTMLRLGLQGILAAEGATQMQESAAELLHVLMPKP